MELKLIDVDKWQEIFSTLKKQKLRTSLTAFGVFWGIFMLVLLLGFGTGYGIKVDALFGDTKNMVYLWSSNKTQLAHKGLGKGRSIVLTQDDVEAIKQKVRSVKMVDGQNTVGVSRWGAPQYIVHDKESGSFAVRGTHSGWEKIDTNRVIEGRYINKLDELELRKVAVIGERVKNILFKNDGTPIGKFIDIQGFYFQVIGVYKSSQPDDGDPNQSVSIYIANSTLRTTFNQTDRLAMLYLQALPGYSAEQVEKDVKNLLYERHKIHPDDQGVLRTYNSEKDYQERQGLVTGVIGFSWMVAIGTIIAGVLGVGNIMLVVVKERTREIGLRKALGATPLKISLMIMQESLLITALSGYAGLIAGILLLEGIKAILIAMGREAGMFSSPYIDIDTALIALVVLVVAGVMASVLPALKAASVNPIAALQDE